MNFYDIKNKFKKELDCVNYSITGNLKSDVNLITNISFYLVSFGGKRIRPLINILFGKIFKTDDEKITMMSSIIELIHTATLLHDDVVDSSEKRRGHLTVNTVWGNKEAILVGDFLYTKSFKMMVEINNMNILKLMSNATNIMSEGEVKQLTHRKNFNITEYDYIDIIRCKTAELFAAAAASSAILANVNKEYVKHAYFYGIHFGIAYQIIDDMLDFFANDENFGKNICDDIINGTFTLPLIILMKKKKFKKKIINIILQDSKKELLNIRDLIINSDVLDRTFELALYHIDKAKLALSKLEKSEFVDIVKILTDFSIKRKY